MALCASLLASCFLATSEVEATEAGEWTSGIEIPGGWYSVDYYVGYPVVAISNDHAVAVWIEANVTDPLDITRDIRASISIDGSWSAATSISSGLDLLTEQPMVAIDSDGDALVVWDQINPDTQNISIFALSYSDGAWTTPIVVSVPSINAIYPRLAMSSYGDAIIVWQQMNSNLSCYSLYARSYSDGEWGTIQLASSSTAPYSAVDARVQMNENGDAILVWDQVQPVTYDFAVYANTFENGDWGTPTLIASDSTDSFAPSVAMDDNGNAVVTWFYGSTSNIYDYSVYSKTYSDGDWEDKQLIGSGAAFSTYLLSNHNLVMDENGDAIAVWAEYNSTTESSNITACMYHDGVWGTVQRLSSGTTDANYPNTAMGDNGEASVVWVQRDLGNDNNSFYRIFACNYKDGAWGTPQIISYLTDSIGVWAPDIAMDHNGDAVAIWYQYGPESDYLNGSISAAFLDSGNAVVTYTRSVIGTVVDAEGNAISGVTVKLAGVVITTDSSGHFEFENVTAGSYVLTMEKDGFEKLTVDVNVVKKTTNVGDLTITELGSGGATSSISDTSMVMMVALAATIEVAAVALVVLIRKKRRI
ncbi:MAG: carboxypeptidase-like regulatory domain-containing protein [Methanomassiliicoccales archaeon]|nr:carboxypeptidase-like regulatory domain-containing protein [Methanomassiliicoccales archaeon]